MENNFRSDAEFEDRFFKKLFDFFIRIGLLIALTFMCFRIISPFTTMLIWALILAVIFYPLHQKIAGHIRGKHGVSAVIVVLCGLILVVIPTAIIARSLGDSLHGMIINIKNNSIHIPEPANSIKEIPVAGAKIYEIWLMAYNDLPGLIQKIQPVVGNIAKNIIEVLTSLGGDILVFIISFVISGIIMAYGKAGEETAHTISRRIVGADKAEVFIKLSVATIRAVALGVIGIACIQAIILGLGFILAGIPLAGILALIVLILGIAQVPAVIVILPVIIYIWMSGGYGAAESIGFTVMLILGGMADNVLKPLMIGHGVDAPMPVILMGALGGMAAAGILGMFLGAIFLSLGYQIFMAWIKDASAVKVLKIDE